jgi:predicted MPP superfamily phosphohydrolase
VRQGRLTRILEKVKRANPDVLVSTGDLVDGQINDLEGLTKLLNEINPRYGKFAITGNHEFYAGISHALDFTEKAGFTILRDEVVTVGGIITIVGVDDPTGNYFGVSKNIPEKALLSRLPRERFTLFLKHRPLMEQSSLGLFDLQLSGHVHKGQIFPFNLLTRLYYPTNAGLLNLPLNSQVYVSRGSGTWGPPIRFLAPPEVTVIELVHG